MSYPILYQAGETNFNHLGLGILKDTISAVVSEDLNGKFELDLVYAYNNRLSKSLVSGNVIKVDAGNILKEQLFTIAQVSKTLDGKISVHAEHISYIMQDLTLKPKTVVYQQDAQNALKQLLNAIKETDHGFTVTSDVSTISSSTWSVPDFKTPRDVLAGVNGSILDNWGGEYQFDNRHISLFKQRGSYANTVIAYGRNMLDFEQETSILETYTSIYPVVVKTDNDVEVTHTLPELVVDSQYLDKYANRKSFLVNFSDKFDDKNPYSDDKLRVLANAYIKANKVGIPKVTMTIKTLDLAKMITDDYKAGRVERLDLADTVKVYFDRLGITTEAKVVGVKWNVLKESYDEYVLGERKATFGTVIRGSIAEVKAVADSAKKDAITALVSADGKNTNYYGNSSDGEPPNPKKGDIWFVKDGDKTSIKTWNGTSWVDLVSSDWQEIFEEKLTEELTKAKVELDAALAEKDVALAELDVKLAENVKILDQTKIDLNQNKIDVNAALLEKDIALAGLDKKIADELVIIDDSIAQAKSDIVDTKTRADDAVDKANANVQAIEANTQLITDVNAIANDAKSQAQTADTNAQTALTSANTANTNANKAISDAGKLSEDVLALDTIANHAKSDADTALINANKGITDAKTALNKAIGVDTRLTTEITNVNNTLATKANSKTVDALSDTVSSQGTEISQNATDIKLKADSTVVNAIEGTVDSQGTLIEQNASDIALKANKSSVDTLTGRVSANETAIDVTSQGISTLVTKTDNTNTSLSQFKQDYDGFKGTVYTKGQTDTKLSTVQQSVDNFKTTVSNTYSSKSETDNKVTAVQENVDKIGNYTAYANSADGTDGFTAVYPNLNLLDGTKDFSGTWTNSSSWVTDGTYKGLTVKKKTSQWGGIYKTFTAPKDGAYTFSAYVKRSGSAVSVYRYVSVNGGVAGSIVPNKRIGDTFDWLRDSFQVTLKAGDTIYAKYEITASGADSILWTAGHKWEQGSTVTDGFTTVYPNLNLLVNSSAKTKDGFFKNFDKVENDYGEVTTKGTNAYVYIMMDEGFSIQPRDYKPSDKYTMSMDVMFTSWNVPAGTTLTEFWIGQRYTKSTDGLISSYKRICSIDLPIDPSNMLNQWIRITKTSTIPPYEDPSVKTEALFMTKFTGASEGSFTVRVRKPKQEQGSIATPWTPSESELQEQRTPWMPSEKELTSNDIPKYVGYSVRQSENPKDFSWQPYSGLNSYKIIEATTSIDQNSNDIVLKANKSEVDTLSGKVSTAEGSITTMAGQIKLKANQTDVNTLTGRVTSAEGSISLISGQVALKANQADVNTITGKVSSLESSLTVQSGQITALNTKTDGHTTQIGTLESSYNGLTSTISKIQTDVGGKAGKTELSQLSQDLSGFKTTVANTYADKVSVASQITQSATAVTSNVQSWTDNKLTAYSTTQQTANSITNAVADKADKTQITQLSNQITSVVESSSQNNLVYNSTLQSGSDGWVMDTGFAQSSARNINGNYIVDFSLASNSDNTWYFARSKQVPVGLYKTYSYAASLMRRTDIANSGVFMLGIEGFDKDGKRIEYNTTNYDYQMTDDEWTVFSDSYTFTNPDVKTVCFALSTNGFGYYIACQPILVNDYKVGSFVPDGMDKSQITQLATDINLRVSKGDIVNQINISPESILIAGNKVQITGQTYIENGVISSAKISDLSASKLTAGTIDASVIVVDNINANRITVGVLSADRIGANTITADKIQVSNLASLSANLGTITAGFIDASKVVVDNINANRITVGTLSADRIAANSITATHISISSLSALSANLGTVTAGTINAATVNIININAGSITTGVLNADRIGANSITADKIKATSLDLFNNDTYTNIRADGMRIQSKAQIVFGNWRDSSNTLRTTQGVYIGGVGGGTKHLAFTRSNGTTFMLRAEQGMDYGTNQNVRIDLLNIYDSTQFWESINVKRDIITSGYIAMGGAVQESSIQYSSSEGTMNFRVPGGRSGSYFWFNQRAISEGSFDSRSKLSLKNVKGDYKGNALDDIVNTNIVEYSYKNDPQRRQLSPIIDDINEIKKYHLPDIINDGESVSLYAMGSLSWLAIKQLAQKLENIEEKLDAIA